MMKITVKIIFVFILLALIVFSLTPTIISTSWGQKKLLQILNERIPGTVEAKQISLSWFGKQKIGEFKLYDEEKRQIVSFSYLHVDAPLWSLLCDMPDIGHTRLENLKADIIEIEPGSSNLQKALFGNSSAHQPATIHFEKEILGLPFTGEIDLLQGNITWQPTIISAKQDAPQNEINKEGTRKLNLGKSEVILGEKDLAKTADTPLIVLSDLNAHLSIASKSGPIAAKITGSTAQGEQQGHFQISFNTASNHQMHISVNVVNLPRAVIMQLIAIRKPTLSPFIGELIGDNLSLSIDQTIIDENTQFQFKGHSTHLSADFSGHLRDDKIILNRTGSMTFVLTPTLMNRWLHKEKRLLDYNFEHPIEAKLNLEQLALSLNIDKDAHSYFDGVIKANIELAPFFLVSTEDSQRFTFLDFKGTLESPQGLRELSFKTTGALIEKTHRAPIAISGKIDAKSGIDALIEVGQLPLVLVDQMFKKNRGYIVEALGEHVNLSLHASSRDNGLLVAFQAKADRLTIPYTKFYVSDSITLVEPTTISYAIDPQLITHLFPKMTDLKIAHSVPIKLSLQHFSMPFGKEENNFDNILIDADLLVQFLEIKGIEALGRTQLQNVQMQFKGTSLSRTKCTFNGTCNLMDSTMLSILWGDHTSFSGEALLHVQKDSDVKMQVTNAMVSIESNSSKMALKGSVDDQYIALTAPVEWTYKLQPEAFAQLPIAQEYVLNLLSPTTLRTIVQPFAVNFTTFDWSSVQISGNTSMHALSVKSDKHGMEASINNLTAPWEINGLSNVIHTTTSAKTTFHSVSKNIAPKEGVLDIDIQLNSWHNLNKLDLASSIPKIKAAITAFPVTLLGAIIAFPKLETLIGNSINIHVASSINEPSADPAIDMTVIGDQFQWSGLFNVGKNISLKSKEMPSIVRWTMTPERFAFLRNFFKDEPTINSSSLALADKAEIRLKITECTFPHRNYLHGAIEAELNCERFYLYEDSQKQSFVYGPIAMKIQSKDLMRSLFLSAYVREMAKEQKKPALFEGSLTMSDFLTNEGALNNKAWTLTGEAQGKNLSIAFLCNVACLTKEVQEQIHALIGKQLDAEVKITLKEKNGPISLHLQGENGQLTAHTQLTNNVITLLKPLEADITVSPKLSQTVLEQIVPFLNSAIRSDKPIHVIVRPQGFKMPLDGLDIATLQAPKVTIDLGKITFSNQGQVADVIELLNRDKRNFLQQQTIWFTPLYIGAENGVVSIERLDMLLNDRFPIAMWGQVNFKKDKVDLKIGLTAETLKQSLSITGLPNDYMLVLPLKGTLSKASIDQTKATARISALIAQAQGGGPGQIIGGVIDLLSGGLNKEDHIPQPTTKPLPWQKDN